MSRPHGQGLAMRVVLLGIQDPGESASVNPLGKAAKSMASMGGVTRRVADAC